MSNIPLLPKGSLGSSGGYTPGGGDDDDSNHPLSSSQHTYQIVNPTSSVNTHISIDNNNNNNNNNNTTRKRLHHSLDANTLDDGADALSKSRTMAIPDTPLTFKDLGITEDTNTLEAKRTIQNHMFGFRPFKSKITKKNIDDHSPEVRSLYEDNPQSAPSYHHGIYTAGNYVYSIFFGSILYVIFLLLSFILTLTYFGFPFAKILWNMKEFVFWPFGKYLQLAANPYVSLRSDENEEKQPLKSRLSYSSMSNPIKNRSGISINLGYFFYYLLASPFLILFHGVIMVFTWLIVITIPTSKMQSKILWNLLAHPLQVRVESFPRPDCPEIIHYPVEAVNRFYYKYTLNGMNICLVNLLPFVILSLIFGYFLEHYIHPVVIFLCCILSTIPLSYYNGMAIASLSAQTSFAVGALINASFGSIIELILYIVTINGQQEEVARSALTGALLGAMLLIPGLSMVVGGIKHKEQKFNPTVMGVSTALLTVAVIGAFAPTIFYKIYGNYSLSCTGCVDVAGAMSCSNCAYVQSDLDDDPVYTGKARTLMYIISGTLPVAYIVGLLFTLKTHTHILHPIEDKEKGHGHGHGGDEASVESEWSKKQCIIVLCVCTTMFALVSEKLVESIDPVVQLLGLTHEFLGVTILGIIPSAAEYLNAIQFALNNNMPLALEIGASAAVQITLFQMPVLVFISAIINHLSSNGSFTLIFPLIDFFAVFFGVIVMNFIFNNGKTNYFIGSTLCIVYLIIVFAFFFTPDS